MTMGNLHESKKVGRLVLLQRIVQEVSSAPDLREASCIIVKRVKEVMNTDVCSIYLLNPATRTLILSATDGLNPAVAGKVHLDCEEGLVGLVVTRSEPVNVRDAARHPRFKLIAQCEEESYHGFLGVPVMQSGKTLGVIVVQQAHARRYRDTDVAFLVTLAAQLAGVIALARAGGTIDLFASDQREHEYYVDAIAGAPGVAIGTAIVVFSPTMLDSVPDRIPEDVEVEETAFRAAVDKVASELRHLHSEFGSALQPEDRALFEALAMIASSEMLVTATVDRIHAGNWAPGALRETITEYVNQFSLIEDPYLRERARDIHDIGRRILAHLQQSEQDHLDYPARTILVAQDLGPISVISVTQLDARELVLDGYRGRLSVNPGSALVQEYARLMREEHALSRELAHLRDLPAETPDGFRVALYTNAGIQADLGHSRTVGAEGIGLYRTELQFMQHDHFPGEEEQRAVYRQVLEAFAPHPVTLRTLDIGSDKTLPYFPVEEPNPALGWRGIRFALDNPVIFITQLRAMIRASAGLENLRILIPMVSSVEEAEEAVQLVRRTCKEVMDEGEVVASPPCGLMIEVPSAVYQASTLARYADFLSVGTNDLTQYLLAVDRGNERVAKRFDSLHPAVITALQHVVEAGRQQHTPVSVCGQAAGDPAMAILLLGMGINSLSMSASDLPRIKSVIRSITREQARSLLNEVLQMEKATPIRELLTGVLLQAGLAGLVRAGA